MSRIADSDDAGHLAALAAKRYRPTIVENVVPARVETVSQTVFEDETFTRVVAAEPSGFREALALDFRKALVFAAFAFRLVIALFQTMGRRAFDARFRASAGAAFRSARRTERRRLVPKLRSIPDARLGEALASKLRRALAFAAFAFRLAGALLRGEIYRSARRTERRRLVQKLRSIPDARLWKALSSSFRRALAFAAFAFHIAVAMSRALERGVGAAFRSARRTERRRLVQKLRPVLNVATVEYRKVRRTLEYEVEVEPERIVETARPSTKRLLTLGRGGVNFRASRTVGGGALVSGPSALAESKRVRFPMLKETPESVLDAVSSMESHLLHVPWALDGDARRYELRDDAPLKLRDEALPSDLFIKPGAADSFQADHVPLRGIERELMEHVEYMSQAFSDRRDAAFSLDNVMTNPRLIGALVPLADAEGGEGGSYPSAADFTDLAESLAGTELQDLAERWPRRYRDVTDALSAARAASLCDRLAEESLDFTMSVGESAFNMHCPDCNRDFHDALGSRTYDVQSDQANEPLNFSANARCVLDYDENGEKVWRCVACENETYMPIPVHKMLDELLLPVYDRLMNENQVERLRAHRDARNKEIEYRTAMRAESETAQFDHFRRMEALSEELQRVQVDIQGDDAALQSLREIMTVYDTKHRSQLASIQATSERVESSIRLRTDQVMRRIDAVKKAEMAAHRQEMLYLAKAQREEDARRDAVQLEILNETREQTEEVRESRRESRRQHEENREESRIRREENRKESRKIEARETKLAKQRDETNKILRRM